MKMTPYVGDVNINIYIVNMGAMIEKPKTRSPARAATRTQEQPPLAVAPAPYHHGSLREALLSAAEQLITRDGVQGLTLRAAAREAGVSHAAPKNHFGDIKGLLSDLAAVGFDRLVAVMRENIPPDAEPHERMAAIGLGYITFARSNPGLFLLMFRGERLDFARPSLRDATDAAVRMLTGMVSDSQTEPRDTTLSLARGARIAASWSLVHGLSILLLDGRLKPLMAMMPDGTDDTALVAEVLSGRRARS